MTASAQSPGADDDATKSESGATTTADGAEGADDAGRLSIDDADRFAAQFRPSWESMDGGWSTAGDTTGEDAPPAEKPEEPAAVAATDKAEPEAPAAPSVVVAPEAPPEASIIVSPEASVASGEPAAPATPEPANVGAPEPADLPSVIVAPESVPPAAPEPVRPAQVKDSSAFDAVMSDPVLPTRKSNRGMFYAAGGVAALIAVAVVAMTVGGSEDDGGDVGAVASAPTETASTEDGQDGQDGQDVIDESSPGAAGSAADPSADEEPAEVRVSIRTEPANARLTLDGQLVDNPYEVSAAAGGTHTVVATAVGFEGSSESVSFGEDVELTVRLNALAAAPRAATMTTARRPAMTGARTMMRRRPAMAASASSRMRRGPMSMGFTSTNPY